MQKPKITLKCPDCGSTHIDTTDKYGKPFHKCRACGESWSRHSWIGDSDVEWVEDKTNDYCPVCENKGFDHGCPRCSKQVKHGDVADGPEIGFVRHGEVFNYGDDDDTLDSETEAVMRKMLKQSFAEHLQNVFDNQVKARHIVKPQSTSPPYIMDDEDDAPEIKSTMPKTLLDFAPVRSRLADYMAELARDRRAAMDRTEDD